MLVVVSKAYLLEIVSTLPWSTKDTILTKYFNPTPEEPVSQHQVDSTLRHILSDIASLDGIEVFLAKQLFDLKLRELILRLHLQASNKNQHGLIPENIYEKVQLAKTHIHANYQKNLTIKELSKSVLLNEFQLKRYFKIAFEQTIHHYIIGLRMEEAKRLILEDTTVNEISAQLGYRSVSHFITIFKNYFGKTPKQLMLNPDYLNV